MSDISAASISSLFERATSSVQHGTLDDALEHLLGELTRVVALDRVLIWRHDADDHAFIPVAGRANGAPWTPAQAIPEDRPPIDRLRSEHVVVELSGETLDDIVSKHGLDVPPVPSSVLLGPIVSGDTFYGMFSISRSNALPRFTEEETAIVRSVAGMVGIAVRTAVAVEAERAQRIQSEAIARQQRELRELIAHIDQAAGAAAMAELAVATMDRLADLSAARVSLWEPERSNSTSLTLARFSAEDSTEAIEDAIVAFEATIRGKYAEDPRTTRYWSTCDDVQLGACRFRIDSTTQGIVTIACRPHIELTELERESLITVTDHLSLGLQRSFADRSMIEARDEARRYADSIGRMLLISDEMSRRHDLTGLYRTMEAGLWSLVSHDGHAFYRSDGNGGTLTRRHSSGGEPTEEIPDQLNGARHVFNRVISDHHSQSSILGDLSILAVPMVTNDELLGAFILWREAGKPFDDEERSLASIFGAHATSELRRHQLEDQRRAMHIGGIRALASTVDQHDPLTSGHADRVHMLARRIAEELRIPPDEIECIEVAALLHDIGKVGIPSAILQKPGQLDEHERAIMMGHAQLGADILRDAQSMALDPVVPLVHHHHEWWDGRGYPAGISGADIPLGAQIIAVADAWDAMTHDRPYQTRIPPETTHRIVMERSGTQFAPAVVEAFDRLYQRGILSTSFEADDHSPTVSIATGEDRLGDIRSLGILVELTNLTAHLTNLPSLLRALADMLARRLDITLAILLRPQDPEPEQIEAIVQTTHGYEIMRCAHPDTVDRMVAVPLPATLDSIPGLPDDPRIAQVFPSPHNTGVVPLDTDGQVHGVIVFHPNDPNRSWRFDAPPLQAVARHLLASIDVARLHAQARADASTDGLTGARNYRGFHRQLDRLLSTGAPFSLLMFDVVGLKQLNDTVGHLAGDSLLVQVAAVLRETLPRNAVIARIGGDEFGVLIPMATEDGQQLGDDVRIAVEHGIAPRHQHAISVRNGWANHPEDGVTTTTLINTADRRMYQHR